MVTMVVGTQIDDNAIRQASNDIQRRFDRLGQNLGGDFMTQFADGAASSAPKIQKALDKAADATGRLRTEQEKLDALTSGGEQRRDRVVSQSERVAKARRDEARAYKEAASAAKDYDQVGQQAGGSFMSGLSGAVSGAGVSGQDAANEFASGFAGASMLTRLGAAGGPIGLALAGVGVLGLGAGQLLASGIAEGMATLQMQDVFQARMGLDESSMGEYAEAAGRAYANNFGLSVADNLSTAQLAKQAGIIDSGATDAEIQSVVEQLQGLATVSEATTGELSRSIITMMRNGLAGSVSEASDIITAGFQSGLDVSGDWLDTINEYSTQARKFGLDASEYMTLLSQGIEGGARDTDKVADSLKEFAIRAVDGSKTTAEGFAALGFNADDLGQRFAAGGDTAKVALDATFEAIKQIDDPMQQALIWQRLFGTQFEDMGDAINQFDLDPLKNEFSELEGVSARSTETAAGNFMSEWETATRTVGQWFSELKTDVADWFTDLPIIRDIPNAITNMFSDAPSLLPGAPGVPYTPAGPPVAPGAVVGAPGQNPLDIIAGAAPQGAAAPGPLMPAGPGLPPAPVPGERTPILTDSEAEAQKESEKTKPVIDPSRFSLDSVPIGSFGDLRVDQLPGIGGPVAPTPGPISQGPDGYGSFEVDPQKVFDAETSLISQRQSVENARQRLLELEAEGTADQADVNAAKTAVQLAERGYVSQQQKLAEAQQGTWQKMEDTAKSFASGMEGIGASLDSDFGASDGLAGIAENLVKFAASLAAAPLLGPLAAIKEAHGDEGSGLLGIAASKGAFGPRFTPDYSQQQGYELSQLGPAALRPSAPAGGYAGDAALLSNVRAGSYVSQAGVGDLTKGIGDCTSAIEDLVNLMDGKPTAGRSMSTGNMAQWALDNGFLPGEGGPGDFRVAFNDSHAQATLPDGTPFNWGSQSAAEAGGLGGSLGADDPALTSRYYRPVTNPVTDPYAAVPNTAPVSAPPTTTLAPFNLNDPALTNPSLTPATPGSGGGGGGFNGIPFPQSPALGNLPPMPGSVGTGAAPGAAGAGFGAPPPPIGSGVIPGQAPGVVPGAGQGMTGAIGGLPLAGIQAAASGLDILAPGAGAAANLGIQLANRTIGFAGQQVGNAVSGIFETFSLSGSNGGATDPMKTLPGRLLSGLAGARPSIPNTAAGGPQKPQNEQQKNPQQPSREGPLVAIENVHQAAGQEPASVANEVADQFRSAELSSGFFR